MLSGSFYGDQGKQTHPWNGGDKDQLLILWQLENLCMVIIQHGIKKGFLVLHSCNLCLSLRYHHMANFVIWTNECKPGCQALFQVKSAKTPSRIKIFSVTLFYINVIQEHLYTLNVREILSYLKKPKPTYKISQHAHTATAVTLLPYTTKPAKVFLKV